LKFLSALAQDLSLGCPTIYCLGATRLELKGLSARSGLPCDYLI
jgi:hypothetical protein